jgi:hypothetical protein
MTSIPTPESQEPVVPVQGGEPPAESIPHDDSVLNQAYAETSNLTLQDLVTMIQTIDQKLMWLCQTQQWQNEVFKGLQSVASMMPGRFGKMAQQLTQKGQDNG